MGGTGNVLVNSKSTLFEVLSESVPVKYPSVGRVVFDLLCMNLSLRLSLSKGL